MDGTPAIYIREGWRFNCETCPFQKACEYYGLSISSSGKYCKVVDFNNNYVTLEAPVKGALVFKTDAIDEDLIPTERDAVPESLLNKVRDDETKP